VNPDLNAMINTVKVVFTRASRGFNVSDNDNSSSTRLSFTVDSNFMMTNRVPFVSHPDRLQQTLNTTFLGSLTDALNRSGLFTVRLTTAIDAHALIVTPSEFKRLQTLGITMDELEVIAKRDYIAYTEIATLCLAHQRLQQDEVVFLRVQAKEWRKVRQDIADLVAQKLGADTDAKGPGIFDPFNYSPVIVVAYSGTKGWVEEDLGGDWCFADAVVGDMRTGKQQQQHRHRITNFRRLRSS